ncbi:hypothetical protein SDC9_173913 [bioreactor metagenome]|uniref:Uncharacterized protein n=1 Tax=bioreactor metagenome TaxID=1076179 RepID=A0A645GHS4_9ZZZZ
MGRCVVVAQGGGELVHEVAPVGEAGERVLRRFAADLFEAGGFFLEHCLDPHHHRVHRPRQALQFRRCRLGDADEAALADRLRLADHGVERAFDPAQDLGAE